MIMKRILLVFAVIGLTTVAAFGQKKETRRVSGFTGINVSSIFDVTVTKGSVESLTIEANDEVMPYVRSEVRNNGVLYLYLGKKIGRKVKTIKVSVVMANFDNVTLSGASRLSANDLFTSAKFKADCSGASNLMINVNTGKLNIEASDACSINLKSNVTGDSEFNIAGASNINIELKTVNMKAHFSGSCIVNLNGSATDMKVNMLGSPIVEAGNLTVKTASIESAGSSIITVNASEMLKVKSSGSSTVNYKGSPVITISGKGKSDVNKI